MSIRYDSKPSYLAATRAGLRHLGHRAAPAVSGALPAAVPSLFRGPVTASVVPLHGPAGRERAAFLWDGYADVLPIALCAPFRCVLAAGAFEGAANGVRGRRVYGHGDRFLVGDAVGYHPPLTAVGMALGFKDALCLAHCQSVAEPVAAGAPGSCGTGEGGRTAPPSR